jgi:hypothetical protein
VLTGSVPVQGIFVNIQNFLCFQLSTAVAALSLITISTALGLPNPLNAMQVSFAMPSYVCSRARIADLPRI